MGQNCLITVQVVHRFLISIVVAEQKVEANGSGTSNSRKTSVCPEELGVLGDRDKSLANGRAESAGEEVERLNKGLHASGRLGVGVLKTSDRDENLRETDENVGRDLNSDVDMVGDNFAVDLAQGAVVTRARVVDEMLNNGSISETQTGEEETDADTHNRAQLKATTAQDRIDNSFEKRSEDENGNRVKVLHEVVGHAVTFHLLGLGDEVARELIVAHPEDGVEDKHLASTKSTLEFIDEMIVPGNSTVLAVSLAPGRFGGVRAATSNHHANGLESIGDDGALGRTDDVGLAAENQDQNTDVEHAEAHEERSPETFVFLHEGSSHERQSTDVDTPVENHVNTLVRDGGVNDNALTTLLSLDSHDTALVLVGNKGSNVRLNTTGTESNDDDGDNVSRQAGICRLGSWERGGPEK